MILAKNNPSINLEDHSSRVEEIATYIAKLSNPNISKELLDKVKQAAYLHDIGKADPDFQNYIQHGIKQSGSFFNHQEVGWAFLKKYTDLDDNILNAVYWHHGISRPKFNYDKRESVPIILKNIDISEMKAFYEKKYGSIVDRKRKNKIPLYYDSEKDDDILSELIFIRMCLISADRFSSQFNNLDTIKTLINSLVTRKEFNVDKCPFKNPDRFNKQEEIVSLCGKTALIKAPAGFGKTMLGLKWAAKSNKKLIWVCPRNTVAKSAYQVLLSELKATGNEDVSVELYLTGETKKQNSDKSGFTADIIVTNIDNFLKPNCDVSNADKLYLVNNCDIVFDEFHELASDAALYKLFVLINNMREEYCNDVRTLFLSATPSLMLDELKGNIKELPNRNSHYEPIHNKNYYLEIKDVKDLDFSKKGESILSVFNSIKNAQDNNYKGETLYHSMYIEDEKERRFNEIFDKYNKQSRRLSSKKNVIGTHIIQASLDISFRNLRECILSPESTIQRIGRCDRWGDYRLHSTVTCFTDGNLSNQVSINVLYNRKLNKKWVEYLKTIEGRITLKDLYIHYNKFNHINKDLIYSHYDQLEIDSNENIAQIYPIKYNNSYRNEEVIDANSGKLRKTGHNIFYLVQNDVTKEWEGPFSTEIYNKDKIDEQFKENPNILLNIVKIQKYLTRVGKYDYGNKHQIQNRSLDAIRRMSVKSNTPYIRFDLKYNNEKGVIKI